MAALSAFARCMKVALQSAVFEMCALNDKRAYYKQTLKNMTTYVEKYAAGGGRRNHRLRESIRKKTFRALLDKQYWRGEKFVSRKALIGW